MAAGRNAPGFKPPASSVRALELVGDAGDPLQVVLQAAVAETEVAKGVKFMVVLTGYAQ